MKRITGFATSTSMDARCRLRGACSRSGHGYSVGRWEGDTLVVETNNLRGAETSPHDGWLDVRGSPYSEQARFIERIAGPRTASSKSMSPSRTRSPIRSHSPFASISRSRPTMRSLEFAPMRTSSFDGVAIIQNLKGCERATRSFLKNPALAIALAAGLSQAVALSQSPLPQTESSLSSNPALA